MNRWLDRIGGPSLTSWPTFWVSLAYGYVMGLVSLGGVSGSEPLAVVPVMVAAQLVAFGLLLAARHFFLDRREPPSRGRAAVAAIVVACAARGVVSASGLVLVGLSDSLNLAYRVPGSTLSMGVALVLLDLAVGSAREHRARLADLQRGRVELEAARAEVREQIHTRQDHLVTHIRSELSGELGDLTGPDAVAELHRVAAEVVRPLSHRLARELREATAPPRCDEARVGARQLVDEVARSGDIPALALPLILALLGSAFPLYAFGARQGLLTIAVIVLGGWASLALVRTALRPMLPRLGLAARVVAITAALLVAGSLTALAASWVVHSEPGALALMAAVVFLVLLLGWVLLVARAAEARRLSIAAELMAVQEDLRWELARLHEIDWQLRREIARALHGRVQGAIGGAGLRLELAQREGAITAELVAELLSDIEAALESLGSSAPPAPIAELAHELARTYAGVCEVEVTAAEPVTLALVADPVCASAVNAILAEGVWGAVRHRGCLRVAISVVASGPRTVTVELCGVEASRPPAEQGAAAGLGTEILNEITLGWRLTESIDGAHLRAVLPCAGSESAGANPAVVQPVGTLKGRTVTPA